MTIEPATSRDPGYNFAYLNEQTKKMIRRALLKAVAIPGYQVPFASREMPMPYGWGTGGVQVTAACLTPDDTLKVIDQGADDTTNAVSIRKFFARTAGVATTEATPRTIPTIWRRLRLRWELMSTTPSTTESQREKRCRRRSLRWDIPGPRSAGRPRSGRPRSAPRARSARRWPGRG